MRAFHWLAVLVLGVAVSPVIAEGKPARLLLVTHSGGFIHDSVAEAEKILKDIGPKNGFEVTCYRFTEDPAKTVKVKKKVDGKDVEEEKTAQEAYSEKFRQRTGEAVSLEQCGRINAETLSKFDAVLFFTTGNPVNKEELAELIGWVKKGGAFAGTHCASDTLYGTAYGELVGGYFAGHPWTQKIKLKLEDPKHAAARGLADGAEINDEIYQFKDTPYSRDKLHIIYSVDNDSIDVKKGGRPDKDYAVAWCQQVGEGRSFYTSLGHRKEVWRDPRFQEHLLGGLKWALKKADGDATPSGKSASSPK